MDWDPRFLERSPAFDGFAEVAQPLRSCREWPRLEFLQGLCDARGVVNAQGIPVRLRSAPGGDGYEARIYLTGEMHVREGDWHDLFNVLAWLHRANPLGAGGTWRTKPSSGRAHAF
jgi:hypothetical protein